MKFIFFFLLFAYANGAKILCYFSFPSISHQVVYQPIWKELSLRGHEVLVLTPDPLNDATLTNLTEIDLSYTYSIVTDFNMPDRIYKDNGVTNVAEGFLELCEKLAKTQLQNVEVKNLLADNRRAFDVILVECFHPLAYIFAAKFKAPVIGVSSMDSFFNSHFAVGNPVHPALQPDLFFPAYKGFYERLSNSYYTLWFRYHYNFHVLPNADRIAKAVAGNEIPYLGDVERNVSLLFLNVNPILHTVRPNVPAVVHLGTMHLKKPKALPWDLQQLLDKAKEGVVYFSLGSNVKSANLTREKRQIIIDALSELPYTVLWKWEIDFLDRQPPNIITRRWLPQQDVLEHKNVKVFLTQGGLQSMEEAIVKRVPLVAMPFFADQPLNVRKMVELGIARSIDPSRMTKDGLKEALLDVAKNETYRKRIQEVAAILTDEPMTGLQRAIWWTEYVIRHKGAKHLKSPWASIPWYQYLLLDVIAFVVISSIVAVILVYKALAFVSKVVYQADTKYKFL